ncbi:MAG: transglutaminase family protein [Gammaproteobacteria bacterium]|jgi:transglutaminase-like putative cysteine protease|nr:transglutaminase family protein [Gammaproteobacteria bacterium]
MKRYKILHQTSYEFSEEVQFLPHTLRLRPREGHELRIENSLLDISPNASLRWHRDVEGNSVATASFSDKAQTLTINSEIIIQKYDQEPYDFLVADYAVDYPFNYSDEDQALLSPYMKKAGEKEQGGLNKLLFNVSQPSVAIQTFALLLRLNKHIHQTVSYKRREEEGVQSAGETLNLCSGSCRDLAFLYMAAAQQLGFAARFISGYIYSATDIIQSGATHAWVEVFIPGAGWKGFDPSIGNIVGTEHIAVAVARLPESVPPVSGSFIGQPGANMTVNVWVTELL